MSAANPAVNPAVNPFVDYVGRPYEPGAQGPDAFDCWGLFRWVQRAHFGRDVPLIVAADHEDGDALAALFLQHAESGRWRRVERPAHGDGVLIRRPMHAGIWLDFDGGGVLHAVRGSGVIFTRDAAWYLSGFGRREWRGFTP